MLSHAAEVSSHVEVEHLAGLDALSSGRREVTGSEHLGYARPLGLRRRRTQRLSVDARTVRRRTLQ